MATLKCCGMVSSSHILIRMSQELRRVPRPSDLKFSAGIPSMPAAYCFRDLIQSVGRLRSNRVGTNTQIITGTFSYSRIFQLCDVEFGYGWSGLFAVDWSDVETEDISDQSVVSPKSQLLAWLCGS